MFLDPPGQSAQSIQILATDTRDVPPASLPTLLAPCLNWLGATGSAFKKIDSLMRDNTFAEIAWLMHSGRLDGGVFAPAFPAQGRFTARGGHRVAPPHPPHGPRTHEHACTLVQAFADVTLEALQTLGIRQPRVAVAGLNPHAGEGSILGKEDGIVIAAWWLNKPTPATPSPAPGPVIRCSSSCVPGSLMRW